MTCRALFAPPARFCRLLVRRITKLSPPVPNFLPLGFASTHSTISAAPFETEHFFAKYEFNTPYQLCNSDCESMSIAELLELADVSIEELGRESLAYTESQGHPELRSLIASTYGTVQPEEVVLLNSPVEGIYLNARAALNPSDEVIVLSPAYDALIHMFEHVVDSSHVKKWKFEKTHTGWELDLDTLASLISQKTKLLVVNFPHNPTGFLPTPDFFKQLAEIVARHNILVFSDEMYHGLVHEGTPEISSAADLNMAGATLSGLSKTYGLPGLRTGWLIVKDATLRQQIINWKFYTSICPPGATEFLARTALKVHEKLRMSSLERIHHNLDFADAFFSVGVTCFLGNALERAQPLWLVFECRQSRRWWRIWLNPKVF